MGGQIAWTYHFSNFGKTPAYNLRSEQFIKVGDKAFVRSYGEPEQSIDTILPPNGDHFNTVVSAPIQKEEFDHLVTITGGIQMKVKITYRDSYGTHYETGICESRLNLGAISYCKENYIK